MNVIEQYYQIKLIGSYISIAFLVISALILVVAAIIQFIRNRKR